MKFTKVQASLSTILKKFSSTLYVVQPIILICCSPLLLITSWIWIPITLIIIIFTERIRTYIIKAIVHKGKKVILAGKTVFHTPAYAILTNQGKYLTFVTKENQQDILYYQYYDHVLKNFSALKLANTNIVELLSNQNLGMNFIKDSQKASECSSIFKSGKKYYVRTTKGLQDKLFVSEVDSIAEIVRNADIVLIQENIDNTKSTLLKIVQENLNRKACMITSGTMNDLRQKAYEAKMTSFFKMEKREDISIPISHGIRVDLQHKMDLIKQRIFSPISYFISSIIRWNDEKASKMIESGVKHHLLYKWVLN